MSDERAEDLAPLAALGLLEGEQAVWFAEAAAASPDCRRDLEAFERVVGLIGLAEGSRMPAPSLRPRVLGAVGGAALPLRVAAPVLWPWLGLAAAAAVVCAVGWTTARSERDQALREASAAAQAAQETRARLGAAEARLAALRVSLEEDQAFRRLVAHAASRLTKLAGLPAAPGARARLVWNPESREGVLMAAGLPPAPEGKAYEVWVIAAGAPAAAGVFGVAADGSATVRLPLLAETASARTFAVTLEPAAGTTAPTGPMVLAGVAS